jgi:hypothetical protein
VFSGPGLLYLRFKRAQEPELERVWAILAMRPASLAYRLKRY